MSFEPNPWQRLETGLRAALPVTLTLLLTLVCALPLGPPALGQVMPALPVICVFYWTVYRGDLMPLVATFVIGVLYDALTGAPLGGSAIVLLVVQAVAASRRRFFHGKTLAVAWAGFAAMAAMAAALGWLVASLYHLQPLAMAPGIFQALLTIALYPMLALPFGVVLRKMLQSVPAGPR